MHKKKHIICNFSEVGNTYILLVAFYSKVPLLSFFDFILKKIETRKSMMKCICVLQSIFGNQVLTDVGTVRMDIKFQCFFFINKQLHNVMTWSDKRRIAQRYNVHCALGIDAIDLMPDWKQYYFNIFIKLNEKQLHSGFRVHSTYRRIRTIGKMISSFFLILFFAKLFHLKPCQKSTNLFQLIEQTRQRIRNSSVNYWAVIPTNQLIEK